MTQALEDLTEELQLEEEVLNDSLKPFLRAMFRKFYDYRAIFSNATSCIGELDCLCTLSVVSADTRYGPMCKPEVLPKNYNGQKILELK